MNKTQLSAVAYISSVLFYIGDSNSVNLFIVFFCMSVLIFNYSNQ